MSFHHKAFEFDWPAFSHEILPWLSDVLAADDREKLLTFIDTNVSAFSSPYDGAPLPCNWKETLEVGDVQEIADFALTKYYDPAEDHGLGDAWVELEGILEPQVRAVLLGQAIEGFDPGRQGSYFLSPRDAIRGAALLKSAQASSLREFGAFVAGASHRGRGVYVTF